MNPYAIAAIYKFELARTFRTLVQSILAPVITTSLYFIVFGSAIGSRMATVDGVPYGAFIVPGLVMLSILGESISNGSFGIYMPKFSGTIYEVLSAPLSPVDIVCGYVGAAASKSILLGSIIMVTARLFVPYSIAHPVWMLGFLVLTSVTFSLFGFLIGIWADGFEKLSIIPMMVVTPLTFLGGSFYSISMLPPFWQKIALVNPVVYLVSGFRWSFYGISDVGVGVSLGATFGFLTILLCVVTWVFKTGWRLRSLGWGCRDDGELGVPAGMGWSSPQRRREHGDGRVLLPCRMALPWDEVVTTVLRGVRGRRLCGELFVVRRRPRAERVGRLDTSRSGADPAAHVRHATIRAGRG